MKFIGVEINEIIMKGRIGNLLLLLLIFCVFYSSSSWSQATIDSAFLKRADKEIFRLMKEGDIPGMSVVYIKGEDQLIKSYGYANKELSKLVTSETLFELGSCSKAFTALGVARLAETGQLDISKEVSHYLPWFKVTFKDSLVKVKLSHLLHHTSGIPWTTISKIPQSSTLDALEKTVRSLKDQSLNNLPGTQYEYATINYDLLAHIVAKVSGVSFEEYMQEQIIEPLGLKSTTMGRPTNKELLSQGYKISFFTPRPYQAPDFKGNNAAGYVVSNAEDVARWLRLQLALGDSSFSGVVERTHRPDISVAIHNRSAYAMGWEVSFRGDGEIFHGGLNPNYTAYMVLRPEDKIAVAVLANSNSTYTDVIGNKLIKWLAGEELEKEFDPDGGMDKSLSLMAIVLFLYNLAVLIYLGIAFADLLRGYRKFRRPDALNYRKWAQVLLFMLPFLCGVYLLPLAIANFSWEAILVWMPESFMALIILILTALGGSYIAYIGGSLFPHRNKYKGATPQIMLVSILSGLSNVVVIIMVTAALDSTTELKYQVFYYLLTIALYLLGRRFVQVNLIKFTRGLICDLKIQIIDKIFATSYENFEKIESGRVYNALSDDVNTVGASTNTFVMLITSVITAVGAFAYLVTIASWAAFITIGLIVGLAALYYIVGRKTNIFFEKARDERNVFVNMIDDIINGFKEINIGYNKKMQFKKEISNSADAYRRKISTADIRFVNAFLIGESSLIILLGVISFGIPELFPNIELFTVMSFIIVLLYLIGPINGILGSVPVLLNLRVAWKRIHAFLNDIPAQSELDTKKIPLQNLVESFRVEGVKYRYDNQEEVSAFEIGPVNWEVP